MCFSKITWLHDVRASLSSFAGPMSQKVKVCTQRVCNALESTPLLVIFPQASLYAIIPFPLHLTRRGRVCELTPDRGQQHKDNEENPHGQAQSHQAGIVILHALPQIRHEVKLCTCKGRHEMICAHACTHEVELCLQTNLSISRSRISPKEVSHPALKLWATTMGNNQVWPPCTGIPVHDILQISLCERSSGQCSAAFVGYSPFMFLMNAFQRRLQDSNQSSM